MVIEHFVDMVVFNWIRGALCFPYDQAYTLLLASRLASRLASKMSLDKKRGVSNFCNFNKR